MLKDFKTYISDNSLLKKGDVTLLAVSGGRDSIVLCELFHKAKLKFVLAHCNFSLRGKESDGDENFVKSLAGKYKVKFFSKRFQTAEFAKQKKLSVQQAARALRYEWFESVRLENGFDHIATAHHNDDELETFFINLVRGTGIAGLHGIMPKRGRIIRPLLFAGRAEIDAFVLKNKLRYREDSSNASDKYLRNKIRHKILPQFEEINPSFRKTLNKDIQSITEVEKVYTHFIQTGKAAVLKDNSISITALKNFTFSQVLLYEILKEYHFNRDVSDEVFESIDSVSGKIFYSATHRLVKDREILIITERNKNEKDEVFTVPVKTTRFSSPVALEFFSKIKNKAGLKIPKDNAIAFLDFNKLQFPLQIRKWKRGDFFYPLGMNKRKKISDFFTDLKLSIPEKENTWLLCSGPEIVYVIGKRIDEHYKVVKETKMIYLVRCIHPNV